MDKLSILPVAASSVSLGHFTRQKIVLSNTLGEHLLKNLSLRANLRRLKINWTGPRSAESFKLLKQVPTLKTLVVVISKSTTNNLSERERRLQKYFTHKGQPRLTDALGFDELLELRNLSIVQVHHVEKSQAYRRTNEERHNLEVMLQDVTS